MGLSTFSPTVILRPGAPDLDIVEREHHSHMFHEVAFLALRLQANDVQRRKGKGEHESRQACAGTHIDQTLCQKHARQIEQRQ